MVVIFCRFIPWLLFSAGSYCGCYLLQVTYRSGYFLEVDPLVVLDQPGLGGLEEGCLASIVEAEDEDEVFVLLAEVLVQPREQGVHPLQDGVASDGWNNEDGKQENSTVGVFES